MKNKASRIALIALFLLLLYAPGITWLFVGNQMRGPNLEKRQLAEWPAFSLAEIESLPGQIEKYYRDHLPFREQVIGLYARASKALFDDCVVTTVLFGRDGWYFYNNINDGDPVSSYRGEDLFTGAELREIVVNLRKTQASLAKQGMDFVLFIAPNKERVYAEYMPERYGAPAEDYAAKQLVEFLRAHSDIKVVYAYDALMEAKEALGGLPLYYKSDTHWNDIGAYVGSRALLQALDMEIPAPAPENIHQTETVCTGDLTVLSHLYTEGQGDPMYTVKAGGQPPSATELDPDLAWSHSTGDPAGKKLFIKNDSFTAGLLPYITPYFSRTETRKTEMYDMAQLDEMQPDIFVLECVERYLRRELTKGPLYILPEDR